MANTKTLEEILAYYGMPEENIESAVNQIAHGYGACRYLEGVAEGANAVGYEHLCDCKIEWFEDIDRSFPIFNDTDLFNSSLLPSQAMKLGDKVGIYMKKI